MRLEGYKEELETSIQKALKKVNLKLAQVPDFGSLVRLTGVDSCDSGKNSEGFGSSEDQLRISAQVSRIEPSESQNSQQTATRSKAFIFNDSAARNASKHDSDNSAQHGEINYFCSKLNLNDATPRLAAKETGSPHLLPLLEPSRSEIEDCALNSGMANLDGKTGPFDQDLDLKLDDLYVDEDLGNFNPKDDQLGVDRRRFPKQEKLRAPYMPPASKSPKSTTQNLLFSDMNVRSSQLCNPNIYEQKSIRGQLVRNNSFTAKPKITLAHSSLAPVPLQEEQLLVGPSSPGRHARTMTKQMSSEFQTIGRHQGSLSNQFELRTAVDHRENYDQMFSRKKSSRFQTVNSNQKNFAQDPAESAPIVEFTSTQRSSQFQSAVNSPPMSHTSKLRETNVWTNASASLPGGPVSNANRQSSSRIGFPLMDRSPNLNYQAMEPESSLFAKQPVKNSQDLSKELTIKTLLTSRLGNTIRELIGNRLVSLDLSGGDLRDSQILALGELICNAKNVRYVKLSKNRLTDGAIKVLANCFLNGSVETLDLSFNEFSTSGCKLFFSLCQQRGCRLRSLNLKNNKVDLKSKGKLIASFRQLSILLEL